MNWVDVMLALAVVAAVALAVRSLVRARAAGGCASCPYAGSCHKEASARQVCTPQVSEVGRG